VPDHQRLDLGGDLAGRFGLVPPPLAHVAEQAAALRVPGGSGAVPPAAAGGLQPDAPLDAQGIRRGGIVVEVGQRQGGDVVRLPDGRAGRKPVQVASGEQPRPVVRRRLPRRQPHQQGLQRAFSLPLDDRVDLRILAHERGARRAPQQAAAPDDEYPGIGGLDPPAEQDVGEELMEGGAQAHHVGRRSQASGQLGGVRIDGVEDPRRVCVGRRRHHGLRRVRGERCAQQAGQAAAALRIDEAGVQRLAGQRIVMDGPVGRPAQAAGHRHVFRPDGDRAAGDPRRHPRLQGRQRRRRDVVVKPRHGNQGDAHHVQSDGRETPTVTCV